MNVQHSKEPLLIGVFQKDGDTDANNLGIHLEIGTAGNPIVLEHGLNRVPLGYQVVWTSGKAVGVPYVAHDEKGQEIKDNKTIQLVFDVDDVIIKLRIW